MSHVVLGAGPLGKSVADQLRDRGESAALYSIMGNPAYDMPGTSPATVDGTDVGEIGPVCKGADVIYLLLNAHYVEWYDLYPPRLDAAIAAAEATGARLIYHDNLYMYGQAEGPLTEETPHQARSRKGRLRSGMAGRFMDAIDSGRIIGAIGRSADLYGPGALNSSFNATLGQRHFRPLLEGRAVPVLGDADAPHTYSYVNDVARGLITLAAQPDALGGVWHLPSAPTLTHRELLTLAFEITGSKPRIRSSAISALFVKAIGLFQKDVGELSEILYMFQQPLVVSHERFASHYEVVVTPHRQALEQTIEWYQGGSGVAAATKGPGSVSPG